jgi:hypothetical protein
VLSSAELIGYRAFDARIKVHLVPNAIDPAGLADQRRSYNTDKPLKLVYVGRLVRTKGLFEMIEALMQLHRAGREFRLSIAGEGPDRRELMVATERAGLKDRVQFLGGVFAAEKRRLWLDSDLFVFPSYMEGLPYSLLGRWRPAAFRHHARRDSRRDTRGGTDIRAGEGCGRAGERRGRSRRRPRSLIQTEPPGGGAERYTVARLADDFHKLYDGCLA